MVYILDEYERAGLAVGSIHSYTKLPMNEATLKYINDHQLVSVMNKTKWRELASLANSNLEFKPKVRLKYLLDDYFMPGFSLLDWEWVKNGDSSCIHWMEIDPVRRVRRGNLVKDIETDFSDFLKQGLNEYGIPFSVESGYIKVWGYISALDKPNFV